MKTGDDTLAAAHAIAERKAVGTIMVITVNPGQEPEVLFTAADLQPLQSVRLMEAAIVELKKQLP